MARPTYIVPIALSRLDTGARLVLGGIHMSDLPSMPYALIYGERTITSVTNNTRADGRAFLETPRELAFACTHTRSLSKPRTTRCWR